MIIHIGWNDIYKDSSKPQDSGLKVSTDDIVFSRKFIKAIWTTMRLLSYGLFVMRTGVVFRNWKAKAKDNSSNLYKGIRELFRSEKRCILVRFFELCPFTL